MTGAHGFLGGYVYEQLVAHGARTSHIRTPNAEELDLRVTGNCIKAVRDIDLVIHLAATVGGIGYNSAYPGDLFYDNAKMGIELIEQSRLSGVGKFVQVGTVCAYPRTPSHIPFREEDLWQGYPEESSAPYGIAKKMLMVQLQAYRAQYGFRGIYLLPTNLYGPRDNFAPGSSHVVPALVRRFTEAARQQLPEVTVWGTGKASREFIFAEDAARGIVLAAIRYDKPDPVNLGSCFEIEIRQLVEIIARKTGFSGKITWDSTKPDGQPRRKLDVTRAEREFGFLSRVDFEDGLTRTIDWYLKHGRPSRSPSIFESVVTRGPHLAVTYANDKNQDGAGAQLQRIYGIYALSRALGVPYVHTPIKHLGYHGLPALENNGPPTDLLPEYNRVFRIPSDIELPENLVIHDTPDADAGFIEAMKNAENDGSSFHLIRILYPFPVTDRDPETYRCVKAISPFQYRRSEVFRLAIHVRRGELYAICSDRMLPNSYYVSCALKFQAILQRLDIPFVCELYSEVASKKFEVTPESHGIYGRISENITFDPGMNHLEDFDAIPNLERFVNIEPIETLRRMATADALILSRSSFSYVAAILSTNGIVVYYPFWHFAMKDWLVSNDDGAVAETDLIERLESWKRSPCES